MTKEKNKVISAEPQLGRLYHLPSIKRLRIILMFLMCINLFGFPTAIGGYVQIICGFVPLAFFIISGYLVLWEDEDRSKRIVRAIKRCAIVFGILAVTYFVMNFFYYRALGVNIFSAFSSKRFWFNFIVMNVWQFDIGSAIWYVQALLYAYIIIYFLDKWNLLRFDWLIAAMLIAFTVVTGELAGVIRWEFLGYNYIPGNFLTRALPYVLLGAFLHRKTESIVSPGRLLYIVGIFVGIALTVGEIVLLGYLRVPGYYGHLIGMSVTAVSVCMLAFQNHFPEPGFEAILDMPRQCVNCIYYLCQPMSVGIVALLSTLGRRIYTACVSYMGIITFVICLILAWLISRIGLLFLMIKDKRTDKKIKLAGIPIKIHTLFDSLINTEEYETEGAPAFTVRITEQDIMAEQRKSMTEAAYERIPYPNYSPAELENTAVYRKIAIKLPDYDAFVFHGSAVAVGEKAYLFTAKSGTGKTTHTNLWLKNIEGSYVINGDKPIIRMIDGKPYVCGTPWMGKEGCGCNKIVPLSAICYLNRGTENHIEKTAFQKIYPRLIGQCYRPENGVLVVKTVKLLEKIGGCVPIYELFCNMEDEAAIVAFRGMSDDKI